MKLYVHDREFSILDGADMKRRGHAKLDTFKNIFDALHKGKKLVEQYPISCLQHPESLQHVPLFSGYTCLQLKEWKNILLKWAEVNNTNWFDIEFKSYIDKLLPHQGQLFTWMMNRELSVTRPGWEEFQTASGFKYCYNNYIGLSLSKSKFDSMVEESFPSKNTGGIISQAVGSGKTRTMLEVIEYCLHLNSTEKTLVIMPTTMISTWEKECAKWIPGVIISIYHGNRRKINPEASIVLTTYRTVCTECQLDGALIKHDCIQKYQWKRIVLDEGHQIRDNKSATFRALKNIRLTENAIKWIITATPVVKNVHDLVSYFEFLGICPFHKVLNGNIEFSFGESIFDYSFWKMLSYGEGYPHMSVGLKKLIGDYIFFQTKEMVSKTSKLKVPVINEIIEEIEPSKEHLEAMETMHEMVNIRLSQSRNVSSHRLRYLLYMRLATYNPSMTPLAIYGKPLARQWSNSVSVISKTAKNINLQLDGNYDSVLKESLEKIEEQNCPICLDSIDVPTVTKCGHLFCGECIKNALEMSRMGKRCPCCRKDLNNTMLREIIVSSEEIEQQETTIVEHSTLGASEVDNKLKKYINTTSSGWSNPKIERLIKWFENNDGKCLVFTSLSTSIISDIKKNLDKTGIGYAAIFGSMTRKQRSQAIERFQSDDNCRVFLLTSRSASYGLTLTAASTVIFFEPILNKSLKQQCIGRIDRLSQEKKELDIISFVVKGSIEEKLAKATKDKDWFNFKDIGL